MTGKEIKVGEYHLLELKQLNVVIGKNGCGKSRMLRFLDGNLEKDGVHIKYITPERAGTLEFSPSVEQNMRKDAQFASRNSRSNQHSTYRQMSFVRFRELELRLLRQLEMGEIQRDDVAKKLDSIQSLLDNVIFERRTDINDPSFKSKLTHNEILPGQLSSGESELISLSIEILDFAEAAASAESWLLIDEPDVHLHPDLQLRLIKFLWTLSEEKGFNVIIATHSTVVLSALKHGSSASVAFMNSGDTVLSFESITEQFDKILPVFGAHPLTSIYNQSQLLLVEGEDDERVWQQAVRSGNGKINLTPRSVDSVNKLEEHERLTNRILCAVYDQPVAFSVRDGDDNPGHRIDDIGFVRRCRLNCYSIENLLLTEEVLASLKTTWDEVRLGIVTWIEVQQDHPHLSLFQSFASSKFDRRCFKIKDLRNDLMSIIGSSKPWEVAVGAAIGQAASRANFGSGPGSLREFLGEDLFDKKLLVAAE